MPNSIVTGIRDYDVSVILTMYNSRKFFLRALNSVLNQTYKKIELIIVDDGSTDGTESVLFPVLKENDFIKYIRHSNRKHPLSLNAGIINSSGKFITFIDSDDEYRSNHLEERIKYFSVNKDIDLIYSPADLIGNEDDMYVPDAHDKEKLIHLNDCIIGGTFFGKRNVFETLNGFKNIYSHDSEFYKRAVEIFNVKEFELPTYVYYRDNPDSVISKLKSKMNGH
ncbi:MAG TPA: glycosyltransferase family A protein [Ignavibacteria bacterium]|nr:glycosyltransferase family A protein [Ignavibacteria bacterium]